MKPSIKFKTATLPLIIEFALPFVPSFAPSASAQAPPGTLWYNGDLDGSPNGIGLWNEIAFGSYSGPVPSQIYDDFTVTWPFGWNVTAVFSDNLVDTEHGLVVGAAWEIRQGVSGGNPGTLIASGFTLTLSATATGRWGIVDGLYDERDLPEYRVMVTGLNLFLSPGQY